MYLIRADGNAGIGAGHLMRCLTIALAVEELQGRRDDIVFICADEESAALVKANGFSVEVLNSDYKNPESEPEKWKSFCKGFQHGSERELHTILVDSYYVTNEYLQALKQFGKVYLLDDMQRCAYPVDGVINYNAFADVAVYRSLYRDNNARCFVGSEYVPIRQQFLNKEYVVSDEVQDILITTGGGDVDNIAGQILSEIYDESRDFHLVIGKFSPHLPKMQKMAETHRNIHVYYDVKDMAGLMRQCDLAVTAGGTTIYELSAMGIPFICFSYAENQEALVEYVGAKKYAGSAGAYHRDREQTLDNIKKLVMDYCESSEARRECSCRVKKMIDGMGAKRLAKALTGNNG